MVLVGSSSSLSDSLRDLAARFGLVTGVLGFSMSSFFAVVLVFGFNSSMDSSMSYSQAQLTMSGMPVRYSKLKGRKLYLNQFTALILKRFHHHRRNFRVLTTNLLLPCFFVALSMAFTSIKPKEVVQPSLEMSPVIYNPNSIFIT